MLKCPAVSVKAMGDELPVHDHFCNYSNLLLLKLFFIVTRSAVAIVC